ncbi:hypothetical protein ACLOAV_010743 [Pseudogymnoascus australis]
MASPLARSILNPKPSNSGFSTHLETPPTKRSKYVVKSKDVLIGYWKGSSEPKVMNKHAMYGVIRADGVFRVKVVPETRCGRLIDKGNYPKGRGKCWVDYDTCVLEIYLKHLIRTEIEEYCRICVVDSEYNNGNQGAAIDRAVKEARRIVAEKAAAEGLNIIEYNRKRCDQLDKGAIAREVEKQRRNGEVVVYPMKVEAKPTAKRSDKAASDARAQMVRLAKKEAKEARERAARNSKRDADMVEAMRRSTSDQEALGAQQEPAQNSHPFPATPGTVNNSTGVETSWSKHAKELTHAYNHLRQGSGTPMAEVSSMNGSETDGVKFYLLDRSTQRAKMEKWCRQNLTSQYHNLDREGQRRLVEKHIDQLIERQTGVSTSKSPTKRPWTRSYPSASPAQPGVVFAPSPLADMTRAPSAPATAATITQEPGATLVDTVYATTQALCSRKGPVILTPAIPTAPKAAPIQSSSRTESPAIQQEVPSEPSAVNIRTNLDLRSVLNEPITPIASESEASTLLNPAYVLIVDGTVETTTTPAQQDTSSSAPPAEPNTIPVATVETETVQKEPTAATTHPTPLDAVEDQRSTSELNFAPSPKATLKEAAKPSRDAAETDVAMADAPIEATQDELIQTEQQSAKPQSPSHLQQQPFSTPQNARNPFEHPPIFMPGPHPYVMPHPTPPSALPTTAPPARAPAIFYGHDGVKYTKDPANGFGDLLVSVDRKLVGIDNVEYTRQLVLVPKEAPRPPRASGEELKWGEEVFRVVEEGVCDRG